MSSLRKSASFRSRIPVRRPKIPPRRCCSPQPSSTTSMKTNRNQNIQQLWSERRYSSSSYSSSDESQESEAPLQRLLKESTSQGLSHLVTVSTDAMSLDGLLDSVSSGSFSDPPSPVHFTKQIKNIRMDDSSYESLDKLNYQVETLKLTNDFDKNKKKTIDNSLRSERNIDLIDNTIMIDNTQADIELEKQRKLSDWYYIKTSPKPKQINSQKLAINEKNKHFLNKEKQRLQIEQNIESDKINFQFKNKIDSEKIQKNILLKTKQQQLQQQQQQQLQQQQQQQLQEEFLSRVLSENSKINSVGLKKNCEENHFFNIQPERINKNNKSTTTTALIQDPQLPPYTEKCSPPTSASTRRHFYIKHNKNNNNSGGNVGCVGDNSHFGEVSSSSFEHVNVSSFLSQVSYPEKLLSSSGNITKEIPLKQQQKYNAAKSRPLPQVPVEENRLYPPKTTSYRTECELSGSYVSLECPSPPGPPACLSESSRDPQSRLGRYLRAFYNELALKEQIIPPWAPPVAPGAICPARLEPELRLHVQSHGFNEYISVDQLLTPIQTKEGPFLEAPRRVLIECPPWTSRSTLALRILYSWSREPPWPTRGTPVALALFIPLSELKGSISNYIGKELLTKGPLHPFTSGFGGFNSAWNSLESLKAKLLIVLDGYDITRGSPKTRKGKNTPQDILDLLEGRLFPESRVIVISVTPNCTDLLPLMQRHVTYEGLTWGRSASLLGGGQWGAPSRLLDTVQECVHLRNMARTPLGCLALTAIYESTGGDFPTEEIDIIESILNCVASDSSQTNVAELGRLALFCLKAKRPAVNSAEIRMYCSSTEAPILGCLDRAPLFGKSARRKNEHFFTPICPGIAEFLAANYLASLVNRPGLLAAEIAGLPMGDDIDSEILKVLTFSMGLLGNRAHVLLSKLTTLWLSPQTIFTLALAGGDFEDNLNALCDLLGISKPPPISPLEIKPIWVQIKSVPTELHGWSMALKGPTCTLKNLELIYQIEKNILLESRNGMDILLDSLSHNESVTNLRISSLIENDVRESDINHIAVCVSKALLKPRLESFELILTLLEEDPPILKLQAVVTSLCRSIPRQPKLASLLLDLGLCTSQLVQICSTLEKCPQVTRLSLPHLRCERGAIGALASLLTARPLASLALPACWGARDDPPSSSGVSMGSGSGSSSGTSGLIKQSSLTGAPSPRSYPPGLFSSLPRGILAPTSNMGRSATLPRQPIEPPPDKRSSDSVVSRTWYPTPACDGGPHNSGTLHDLLLSARETYSKLHGLDLSKAQLTLEDSMCLGETVRLSTSLHSLKIEGASRLSEILPAILGAGESTCLQMISLGSPRLALEDGAITMAARALTNCSTLRLINIEGWSFRIENSSTLSAVRAFLTFTSARELGLSNCRLHLPTYKNDIVISSQTYECRSVVVLKMAGAQVILADNVPMKGPQLLPFLNGFPCLRELDLSAPARSGLGSSTSAPLILGDKCIVTFFQHLHTQFSMLNTLKLCNWIIHLDDSTKTFKMVSKCLRNSPLSHVKTDGISVLDRPKKSRIEPQFLHSLLSSLPSLRWMGMSLAGMSELQITSIGNAVLDMKGQEIDIRLSDSTIENARAMTQSLGLDGKFDIKVSTFGTSTGILIHVEKSGTKSLTRKK